MFFDPLRFEFTGQLEERAPDIRREFEQLSPRESIPWPERDLYNQGWDVFGLWAMGQRLDDNCQMCPSTAQAVASIPRLTTAGFSIMRGGTRIRPHVGYSGTVLRCHLGLIVPPGCALQVGDETRHWEEGKCLVFDDTVLHSAWNESQANRVILLMDFVRPGMDFDGTISPEVGATIESLQQRKRT
jgi:beta-hydroxylase